MGRVSPHQKPNDPHKEITKKQLKKTKKGKNLNSKTKQKAFCAFFIESGEQFSTRKLKTLFRKELVFVLKVQLLLNGHAFKFEKQRCGLPLFLFHVEFF